MAEPEIFESLVESLARDPALGAFARPDAALLIWDGDAERLLWTSPGAASLKESLADASGLVARSFPDHAQVKALAAGLAPNEGFRLDRLRFDSRAAPVTCVCRRTRLPDGRAVLLTAAIGAPPPIVPRRSDEPSSLDAARSPASAERAPAQTSGKADRHAVPTQRLPQGDVRFLWQADADGRFTSVSPAFAEAVGQEAGAIVGRTWEEACRLAGALDAAGLFKRGETWSGRIVSWPVDGGGRHVPVEWAGMPVNRLDQTLAGHRGFGIVRRASAEHPAQDVALPAVVKQDPELPRVAPDLPGGSSSAWFADARSRVTARFGGRPDEAPPPKPAPDSSGSSAEEMVASQASRLSATERNAFREIARALRSKLDPIPLPADLPLPATRPVTPLPRRPVPVEVPAARLPPARVPPLDGQALLDQLPMGALIHREERIVYANPSLLGLLGCASLADAISFGGLGTIFGGSPPLLDTGGPVTLHGRAAPAAARVTVTPLDWEGLPATLLLIAREPPGVAGAQIQALETNLASCEARIGELEAVLDIAADGVVLLDGAGRVTALNRSAEALFGCESAEAAGKPLAALLAPESREAVLADLARLKAPGLDRAFGAGRDVLVQVRRGAVIPVFMSLGPLGDGAEAKACAVLRDLTAAKRLDEELARARRAAEEAAGRRSDLLARISHEIRAPLNAIIGFAEIMLEERFGSLGNERYREYLQDVRASGAQVVGLVDSLHDLAQVEAGALVLAFTRVRLNEVVSACVAELQPVAARERIVLRTSFAPRLPLVLADERSLRQVVLNILSNAIRFTDAGGQAIVSTALTDRGELALRVRDTGIGMSEEEVAAAVEPFRPLATARRRGGTGLGLPLAKALAEANWASLRLATAPDEGTLVEILFPPSRVTAS